MFGHTARTIAAALAVMATLVAMTLPAGAGPALHKKQPIAQETAPKPTASTERPAFNAEDQERAIIPRFPDARFWGDSEKDFLQATRGATGPWLALSAGGADGAFGAGLLSGLSASGQRPDFTVITGVSTGALMAPFVFVGARQDESLRKVYTTINAGDVFELAQTRDSLLDTWPLRRAIEKQVTPQLLDEVAAEHHKGRRLFVLTVNIDAGRPVVVWNMGAIAAHGGDQALALFRRVLLASASVPGVFPTVYIDVASADGKAFSEMHGDGGVQAQFYVAPESMLSGGCLPATELYVVVNGKLRSDFAMTNHGALTIITRAVAVATTTAVRGQVLQAYAAAQRQGIGFHLAMVAPNFAEPSHGPFDTASMQALFDFGMKQGQGAAPFLSKAPDLPNATTVSRPDGVSVGCEPDLTLAVRKLQ